MPRVFLTVETDRKIVAWSEITDIAGPALGENSAPDVGKFAPGSVEYELSGDGVAVVTTVKEPFGSSLRNALHGLLAEGGHGPLSGRGFRQALRRGQLTCHFGATTVAEKTYAGVAGLDCVNNLLFSTTPSKDPGRLIPSLALIGVSEEEDAGFVPEEDLAEAAARAGPTGGWVLDWQMLLPILKGVTVAEKAVLEAGRTSTTVEICPENLPDGVTEDAGLVGAVAAALIAFRRSPEGGKLIFERVRGKELSLLWDDPCFPGKLAPFLFVEHVGLLVPDELRKACSNLEANAVSEAGKASPEP